MKNAPPIALKENHLQTFMLSHKGFSLVEILVVIVVVAILAAIIAPMVDTALVRAGMAKCTNRLRTVGTAKLLYAADHGGMLPGFDRLEGNGTLSENVTSYGYANSIGEKLFTKGYVDNLDVFFCPVDKTRQKVRKDSTGWAKNPLGSGDYVYTGYWHFYVREGTGNKSTEAKFNNRYRVTDNPKSIIAYDQRGYAGVPAFHPKGDINILRLDGSVENILFDALDPNNGINAFLAFEPEKQ